MRSLLCLISLIALPAPGPALAAGLNDTGIDFCGDATTNSANCTTVFVDGGTYPGQDARYGRDAAAAAAKLPKLGGGEAGFDFTALDASGQPTTPSAGANPHPCVRDNVSGLVWEVKTADGSLRDQQWTYTWYESVHNYGGTASGTTNCKTRGRCDTEKYVVDVKATSLCGFDDWRLPTDDELQGIVHYGRVDPSIDPTYFPNTLSSGFWSSSPAGGSPDYYGFTAWSVYFFLGSVGDYYLSAGHSVRLVRSGQ